MSWPTKPIDAQHRFFIVKETTHHHWTFDNIAFTTLYVGCHAEAVMISCQIVVGRVVVEASHFSAVLFSNNFSRVHGNLGRIRFVESLSARRSSSTRQGFRILTFDMADVDGAKDQSSSHRGNTMFQTTIFFYFNFFLPIFFSKSSPATSPPPLLEICRTYVSILLDSNGEILEKHKLGQNR